MKSIVTAEKRVRTKGASEMIVKRRLGILQELMDVYSLKLRIDFVKKSWLGVSQKEEDEAEL